MKGYVGLTDPGWYRFLESHPQVDEVNFWRPKNTRPFRALKPGEMFFFKLRAPLRAIAGFGFFSRYEVLPAWLAWESFEQMNGAPNLPTMLKQILPLRGTATTDDLKGIFPIGCIMLGAPIFFPEKDWIEPPRDWARTGIQEGKGYDLSKGEGKRLYDACLERAMQSDRHWNVDRSTIVAAPAGERFGQPVTVRPRLGQGLFRFAVRDAYSRACAITGEHSTPVLEAAHIKPYAYGGEHRIENGLYLRRDLHRLFDLGYATVTPDYRFRVGDRLHDEYHNGKTYYELHDSPIILPSDPSERPSRTLLEWHQSTVFKG